MRECAMVRGLGWLPDYPDFRDYNTEEEHVAPLLKKTRVTGVGAKRLKTPQKTDLRQWCSPIEDQGPLGSCTAHAGVGMYEYFERRAFGEHLDASRLFLYKVTRSLMQITGDQGAFLRTTMGALALFGTPPEEYWPYDVDAFDDEPPAFCYAFAQNFQALVYYRLDTPGTSRDDLLSRIKLNLHAGLPSMFGFAVYSSIDQADESGKIPYPLKGDRLEGGHAVLAVGYDDRMKIQHTGKGAKVTTGALLIRNSWGRDWGDGGYGWLPYDYVKKSLADDWWSMVKGEWIETGQFKA